MINEGNKKIHWNHFLALEKDLETISRYVELTRANDSTYSIELAKLLFAAASEVEVVLKEICALIAPDEPRNNINAYRRIIKTHQMDLISERVFITRFGLDFLPWEKWTVGCDEESDDPELRCKNPVWWKSYNDVKHNRNEHYSKANLKNTLNALGALLIVTTYYYKIKLSQEEGQETNVRDSIYKISLESSFIKLKEEYYPVHMVFE